MKTSIGSPEEPKITKPIDPAIDINGPDPELLRSALSECAQDQQKIYMLAWLATANSPLRIPALETAIALLTKPECSTLAELNEIRSEITEESLEKDIGIFIKFNNDRVALRDDTVKDYFASNKPLHSLPFWDPKGLDFSIAKACVVYLSLDDFRDLPLPVRSKGTRFDLEKSDPFLTYASKNWHKYVHSSDDAKALEPWLDNIINPERNNVYLWNDQSSFSSSSGGPQHFFRSRAEIAIQYNIRWLAAYLLESTMAEPRDVFPARDLVEITKSAPGILQYLLEVEPDYYRPAINRKVLLAAATVWDGSAETLQTLLENAPNLHLPNAFLGSVAQNRNADQMFEFLFSKIENIPITSSMLNAAAGNRKESKLLRRFFDRDPSLRVNERMVEAAINGSGSDSLRVLFEHDPETPVTPNVLERVIRMECYPKMLKAVLEFKPDVHIPPNVIELAAELNREGAVKLLFENYEYLEITDKIIKNAAFSHSHELGMTEYLLSRCDPTLMITQDVLLTATRRWNSPDKMVALLLKHNDKIEITDEMLISSCKDWDGKTLAELLKHRGGQEVPNEIVDQAIKVSKSRLSWTWRTPKEDDPCLLYTLKQLVPNDPYLQKMLAETDFTPPPPKTEERAPWPSDLPDAAKTSDIARLKKLLDQGIDVDTQHGSTCGCDRNKGHGTALQRAVKQRDIEMTKLLLSHGANPNLQGGEFGNPLQQAAKAGDMQLVQLLVSHKADVNLQGGKLTSPLIAAAMVDDAKIVRYLIEHGADINIADKHGWTPYLHAVANESWDAARALVGLDEVLPKLGELIALNPGKLVRVDKKSTVEIGEDGLTIRTDEIDEAEVSKRVLLRADHPIVPTEPFYFEMSINRMDGDGIIAIGLSTPRSLKARTPALPALPGHSPGSWGYHGDDGHLMDEMDHYLTAPYPTYGINDVVGCGVDYQSRTVFFTKNGVRLGGENGTGVAFHMVEAGMLFPVIGVGSKGMEVSVNFGETGGFVYQG